MSFFTRWFTPRPYKLPNELQSANQWHDEEEIEEVKENTAVLTINFRDGNSMWMTSTGGTTESLYASFDEFEGWWDDGPIDGQLSYTFVYGKGKQMVQREFIKSYSIKFDITETEDTPTPTNNVVPLKLVK